jgi:hypothetical protein
VSMQWMVMVLESVSTLSVRIQALRPDSLAL